MRRQMIATAAAAAALLGMTVAAADSSTAGKVRICHGTASQDKNPYVLIEVNANALKDGHFKDGVGEAHGWHNMPDFIPADVRDIAAWPGFWRLARRHWRTGVDEVVGSASTRAFMRKASRYVPDIGVADVVRGGSGVRAQAVERDGSLVDDFRITRSGEVTCVRNAPSPAATSSLAIAAHVVDRVWP